MRSRRNIAWWRSNIHSPARWPIARERSSDFELVDRPVVGQLEQDHVVEVPAIRHVVPAQKAHPELLLVALDLAREDLAHEELEERVAPTANREERGQYGHGVRLHLSYGARIVACPALTPARGRHTPAAPEPARLCHARSGSIRPPSV